MRKLRTDGGRQPETHRPHAAGSQPQTRVFELRILCSPHLMLTDAGRDDRLAARQPVDLFDDVVWLDELAVAVVVHRVRAFELGTMRMPFAEITVEPRLACIRAKHAKRLRQ